MDAIPYLTDFGPVTLAGLAVLLILIGRLVPRRSVEDARADAEHWRKAWELSEQARVEEARQTGRMIETLDMHTRLLESIRDRAQERTP